MRMLLQFKKDDIVRHLGLLDLQRTMQRALRRSGLPVTYSKGFNPHIVMSFASALSSGIPGDAELLDVALCEDTTEEACLSAMNRVLPPSLQASRVRLVDDHFPKAGASLAQAEYRMTLYGKEAEKLTAHISSYLSCEEIMALRKTKKSETLVNIRPMIHELSGNYSAANDSAVLITRVSFVESATLKPELLLSSLCEYTGIEIPKHEIRRTRLLGLVNGQAIPLIDM